MFYDGYKNSRFQFKNLAWVHDSRDDLAPNPLINITMKDEVLHYPSGRNLWYKKIASCKSDGEASLSLSTCDTTKEFTCNSGQCISIYQRCDGNKDCNDSSDEDECKQFTFSGPYNKETPPSDINLESGRKEIKVYAHIDILTIDEVNTIAGNTELTYVMTLSWIDSKMIYLNLLDNSTVEHLVVDLSSAADIIWTPLSRLTHSNSIVGTVLYEEESKELQVHLLNKPSVVGKAENSFEEATYDGGYGTLSVRIKLVGIYKCRFDLFRFPFDTQVCSFKLKIKDVSHHHIKLISTEHSVSYHGHMVLEDFEVIDWYSCSKDDAHGSEFIFFIRIEHLFYQQLSTTYFQIVLMWSAAYLTFFIDINDFSNRFMGSVTALLVLSAMMDSLNQRLPSSGDLKLIDVWNIWFVVQLVLINVVHVIISKGSKNKVMNVQSQTKFRYGKEMDSSRMNSIAIRVFPLQNLVFVIGYFVVNQAYEEIHDVC